MGHTFDWLAHDRRLITILMYHVYTDLVNDLY